MMKNEDIHDGELLAYLEGEDLPHVAEALANSLELQRRFDELKQLHEDLFVEFEGVLRPDPQDLVDVVAGQASQAQKLIVAAYVRNSVRGREELRALEAEWAKSMPAQGIVQKMWELPQFLARPLSMVGVRGNDTNESGVQTYYAADVQAQIAVQIPPPSNDLWQIQGYVTHEDLPLAATAVSLYPITNMTTETDEMGFFVFENLTAGRYDLRLHLRDSIILIPDIYLIDE